MSSFDLSIVSESFVGFFIFFLSFFDSPLVSQMALRLDCFHFDEAVDRGGSFLFRISCWPALPPPLSASVFPFPLCLLEPHFFRTRPLSPSACSVLNAMRPPFRLCIYDIPKTLNTVGFSLSWWRELECGSVRIYFYFFYKLPIWLWTGRCAARCLHFPIYDLDAGPLSYALL